MTEPESNSILAYCTVCECETVYRWFASWTDVPSGCSPMELYNCTQCGATRTARSLRAQKAEGRHSGGPPVVL